MGVPKLAVPPSAEAVGVRPTAARGATVVTVVAGVVAVAAARAVARVAAAVVAARRVRSG
ncbi:hypothetical protein ACGFYP_08480 [Streptomyces sp. NPDC048370]|uniref:hypothetical protein n=1 Tax=Streptomyces sp. NPDC048370 TaxID=3365540 RepID=UPI00371D8B5F